MVLHHCTVKLNRSLLTYRLFITERTERGIKVIGQNWLELYAEAKR